VIPKIAVHAYRCQGSQAIVLQYSFRRIGSKILKIITTCTTCIGVALEGLFT